MFHKDELREAKAAYENSQDVYKNQFEKMKQAAVDLYGTKRKVVDTVKKNQIPADQLGSIDNIIRWQNIQAEIESFQQVEMTAQKQISDDMDGTDAASGIGGMVAGAGVAAAGVAAPTALIAMTTTFGVASTGTAISTLSGAALTNATLAAIGGGSMAAGSTLLGALGPIGIAAGIGVLGVTGFKTNKKNKEAVAEYRSARNDIENALDANQKTVGTIGRLDNQMQNELNTAKRMLSGKDISDKLTSLLSVATLLNTAVTEV